MDRKRRLGSDEELLMSQVVGQEVLTRLPLEKGISTREEFFQRAKVVDREMKRKRTRGDKS